MCWKRRVISGYSFMYHNVCLFRPQIRTKLACYQCLLVHAYTPVPLHLRALSQQTIHGNEHIFVLYNPLYNFPPIATPIHEVQCGGEYNQGRCGGEHQGHQTRGNPESVFRPWPLVVFRSSDVGLLIFWQWALVASHDRFRSPCDRSGSTVTTVTNTWAPAR